MAPAKLKELLETLREFGVQEYEDGPVHVVMGPAEPRALASRVQPDTGEAAPSSPAAYNRLFKGRPPSFADFKALNLPVTE